MKYIFIFILSITFSISVFSQKPKVIIPGSTPYNIMWTKGNIQIDSSEYVGDSIYSLRAAIHGSLYVGDSATYAPRSTQDTIYGFGNSIMAGTGATDGLPFFFQYCNYVNAFGLDSGLSGTTLADFQSGLMLTLPLWTPHHKIMLLYETNEYFASQSLNSYLGIYVPVINYLETQKGYQDTSIILAFCSYPDTTISGNPPSGLATWANSLDSMATVLGIPHADLYHYMLDNGGNSLTWAPNREHPNQSGHNAITQALLLGLNKGGSWTARPINAYSIKSPQQLLFDAPTILTVGDKIRQYNTLPRTAWTDILTYSDGSDNLRPQLRGGGGVSGTPLTSYMVSANAGGNNIPVGFMGYSHTDSLGTPLSDNYGLALTVNPNTSEVLLSSFSGPETGPGGPILIAANTGNGIWSYFSGGVSIGGYNPTNNFYVEYPTQIANNFYPLTQGSGDNTDVLQFWHPASGEADTVNLRNADTAAFLQMTSSNTPINKHIYPSTIGADLQSVLNVGNVLTGINTITTTGSDLGFNFDFNTFQSTPASPILVLQNPDSKFGVAGPDNLFSGYEISAGGFGSNATHNWRSGDNIIMQYLNNSLQVEDTLGNDYMILGITTNSPTGVQFAALSNTDSTKFAAFDASGNLSNRKIYPGTFGANLQGVTNAGNTTTNSVLFSNGIGIEGRNIQNSSYDSLAYINSINHRRYGPIDVDTMGNTNIPDSLRPGDLILPQGGSIWWRRNTGATLQSIYFNQTTGQINLNASTTTQGTHTANGNFYLGINDSSLIQMTKIGSTFHLMGLDQNDLINIGSGLSLIGTGNGAINIDSAKRIFIPSLTTDVSTSSVVMVVDTLATSAGSSNTVTGQLRKSYGLFSLPYIIQGTSANNQSFNLGTGSGTMTTLNVNGTSTVESVLPLTNNTYNIGSNSVQMNQVFAGVVLGSGNLIMRAANGGSGTMFMDIAGTHMMSIGSGSGNVIIQNTVGSDSALRFDVRSTTQASRPHPAMSYANFAAISAKADGSGAYIYPQDKFVYQADAYGAIDALVDSIWASTHYAAINGQPYTLFAPTTGGSITLVNNNYNIVNPSGAILALTVVFPSSPADKDEVQIKFDQAVTTVTYSGGSATVLGGLVSPVLGSYVKFKYSSSTTTWY